MMDFLNELLKNQALVGIVQVVGRILIIWILAMIITHLGSKAIEKFFHHREKAGDKSRNQTLTKLCQNLLHYIIYFIAGITILDMFISITPLLTGAGVLGLAIGFGAQAFVKDVVTGFFILFEGQYDVGDKVEINGISGKVEELGIRSTVIHGENGEKYYVSNGTITQVANLSKEAAKQPEA